MPRGDENHNVLRLIGPPNDAENMWICLMPLAERMLRGAPLSSLSTLSACQLPLLNPRNVAPLKMLPPSFSTLFNRIPPPEVSAGIALVMTVISDCSMSSK